MPDIRLLVAENILLSAADLLTLISYFQSVAQAALPSYRLYIQKLPSKLIFISTQKYNK